MENYDSSQIQILEGLKQGVIVELCCFKNLRIRIEPDYGSMLLFQFNIDPLQLLGP